MLQHTSRAAGALLWILPLQVFAEPTLELYIRDAEEVFQGDPVSTTVDAEGRIALGLTGAVLAEGMGQPVIAFADSPSGLLLGTAGGGLVQVRPGQPPKTASEKDALISAVAAAGRGAWFATGPKGRIHYWDGRKAQAVVAPDVTYVWDLLADGDRVLAVTGQPAQLLEVQRSGYKVLFSADETHLRVVVRHPRRGLIVGGGQKGVVYQFLKSDRARALYDSPFEEITALSVDPQTGDLYAAAVSGEKSGTLDPGTWIGPVADDKDDDKSPFKGTEVVRIRPSGEIDRVWTSRNEGALALAFHSETKRLFIATGTRPKGRSRIYAVETEHGDRVVLVARLEPSIASGLSIRKNGSLIVTTAPDGAVHRLGPRARTSGTYLSVEQDLQRVARIGRLWFDADLYEEGSVSVRIRTGNTKSPDATWSDWSRAVQTPLGGAVEVPRGRYAQFKAELRALKGRSPTLRSMHASVRRVNLAPTVQEVFPLHKNVYLKPIPPENESVKTMSLSLNTLNKLRGPLVLRPERLRVRVGEEPGTLTVAWKAVDPNGDALLFFAHLLSETGVKTELGRDLEVPFVSFDSRAHPDGRYRVLVRATDRPMNAPGEALSHEQRSELFIIDNAPPTLSKVSASASREGVTIRALAEDASSRLLSAEVSLDGGPWLLLPPEDGLLDNRRERFRLLVQKTEKRPQNVRVRVEDRSGNRAAAGAAVR